MKDIRFSSLLHTLILLVLLTLPHHGDKGNAEEEANGTRAQREEPLAVTIIDPPKKDEEVVVEEDAELEALKKLAPHAGEQCEHFYGGIGIIEGVEGVTEVYPGYPAALAGIEVGDFIKSGEAIRGEIGTPVTVVVVRGLRTITFELVRDKICVA